MLSLYFLFTFSVYIFKLRNLTVYLFSFSLPLNCSTVLKPSATKYVDFSYERKAGILSKIIIEILENK